MKITRLFALAVALLTFSIVGLVFGADDTNAGGKPGFTSIGTHAAPAQASASAFDNFDVAPATAAAPANADAIRFNAFYATTYVTPREVLAAVPTRRGLRLNRSYIWMPEGSSYCLPGDDGTFHAVNNFRPKPDYRGVGADNYARARI